MIEQGIVRCVVMDTGSIDKDNDGNDEDDDIRATCCHGDVVSQ